MRVRAHVQGLATLAGAYGVKLSSTYDAEVLATLLQRPGAGSLWALLAECGVVQGVETPTSGKPAGRVPDGTPARVAQELRQAAAEVLHLPSLWRALASQAEAEERPHLPPQAALVAAGAK